MSQLFDNSFDDIFQRMSDEVMKAKNNGVQFEADFLKCNSDEQKVALLLNDSHAKEKMNAFVARMVAKEGETGSRKSLEKASNLRKEGNEYFKRKDMAKALFCYNEAMLWAPQESECEELSLCFANRSAAFFHLNLFNEALLDVNESLARNYPKERIPVLLIRKLKCLKSIGENAKAKPVSEEAKVFINNNVTEVALKEGLIKQIDAASVIKQTSTPFVDNLVIKDENECLYGAKKSVKMGYNSEKGRTIEATKVIEEGEIIVAQKPFASWLAPSYQNDHCHHCLSPLNGRLVPCIQCSSVRFCSTSCLDESWSQYHKIECPHLEGLRGLSVGNLTFRTIIIAGVEEVMKVAKEPTVAFDKWPEKNFKNDFRAVSSFTEPTALYPFRALLPYSLAATVFTLFAEKLKLVKEKDRSTFGGLMLALYFQQNTQYVFDTLKATKHKGVYVKDFEPNPPQALGVSLNSTVALFNHSCHPNAKHAVIGSKVVVVASRTIKKGEEVCVSYKQFSRYVLKKERQQQLKAKLGFDCRCDACSGQESYWPYFRCPACGGNLLPFESDPNINECMSCDRKDQIIATLLQTKEKMKDLIHKGRELMGQNRLEEAESTLLEAERLSRQVFQKKCPELIDIILRLFIVKRMKDDPDFEVAFNYGNETVELEKSYPVPLYPCRVLEPLFLMNLMFLSKEWLKRGPQAVDQKNKYYQEMKAVLRKIERMELKIINVEAIDVYVKAREMF